MSFDRKDKASCELRLLLARRRRSGEFNAPKLRHGCRFGYLRKACLGAVKDLTHDVSHRE